MTASEIQSKVADRLNLTSASALSRIMDSINEAYRMAASSIGLQAIQEKEGVTATTTIGQRSLTFGPTPIPVEKILRVYNTAFTPPMVLDEEDMDTLRNDTVMSDPPLSYAIETIGPNFVTIYLDVSPASAYVLTADVLSNVLTMSGSMSPQFPEDFHDCLERYAMAIELEKLEKYDMAAVQMKRFEQRVSDLRFYVLKSAYREIWQGRTRTRR